MIRSLTLSLVAICVSDTCLCCPILLAFCFVILELYIVYVLQYKYNYPVFRGLNEYITFFGYLFLVELKILPKITPTIVIFNVREGIRFGFCLPFTLIGLPFFALTRLRKSQVYIG